MKRGGGSGNGNVTASVRVKICGITRLEDALLAESLGADALGFNFWSGSKRFVSVAQARRIIEQLSPFVLPVGVFVGASRAEVKRVMRQTGIRAVQLHGGESPAQCAGYSAPVVKALPVADARSLRGLEAYRVAAFLFDTPTAGHGGSGQTFDWRLLSEVERSRPFLLAGGLHPDNVRRAVRSARPDGVDVASGVERAPGIKDAEKLKRFIQAAKEA